MLSSRRVFSGSRKGAVFVSGVVMAQQIENVSLLISVTEEGHKTLARWFAEGWVYVDGFAGPGGLLVVLERETNADQKGN